MPAARPIKQNTPDPVRILLIEAEHECAERVIRALERIEWAYARIDTAASLRQALARLKLEKFDLVITGLELPDCGGLATLDEVGQAFDRLIIVLTADEDPALRERVIAHGAFDVLQNGKVSEAALERLLRLASAQVGSARSLRDSEARFLKTFELAGSGIAHLDLDGRFLRVNRKLCEILGYAENELVGRALRHFAHPEDGNAAGAQGRYVRKDGATLWVAVNTALVRDVSGNPHYEICVVEDITERKQVEARQEAHARCQEALAKFGHGALALREPKELIDEALRTATHAIPAREVAFIEAGDALGMSAGLLDVLHCGVHFVGGGTAIVPVRRDGEVRGALSAQGERVGAATLPFLNTLASLLSTALQRIDSERRLSFLAQFDPLTGLANRALLSDRLAQMIEEAKRRSMPLAMLYIDLDHFKLVNDALKHAGGDELLKETALRVQSVVRIGDLVARVNGDEFVVVLPELEKAEDAALVAQKVLDRLSQRFMVRGEETFLTASVGIAAYPGDADAAAAPGRGSGRSCTGRWNATSSTWCTSRRSTWRAAGHAAPRRCCAGTIPSAA
jgi:diguanylate cyclase (GGDEF)-like protein